MKAVSIEVLKTNIKTEKSNKSEIKDNKNINFLDLLLKDIKTKQSNNIETKDNNSKDKKNDLTKDVQELLKDLLLDKKNENILNEIPNMNNILDKINFNQDMVKEIKNIIKSNLKQQNILLNKADIKTFKKIDNIKDLIKFADKKGLNVEKITFDIVKNVKIQKLFTKSINMNKENDTIQDKNIKKTPSTSEILNIFNKKENKNNNDKKIISDINNNLKIKHNFIEDKKDLKLEKNIDNIHIKDNNPKIEKQKIDLNTLLHSKENVDKKSSDKINNNEIKKEPTINNQTIQNININQNELKIKQIQAKETMNHFKNNLDEAIKNYKPPISKVNIELNPKNLGKVEVSIIQRGNNISLHMNTDQSNIALFQNHQAEFRQALTNIGFSNIDMNFNSNQEKERKENQAKKSYKKNSDEVEIGEIKVEAKYQYA